MKWSEMPGIVMRANDDWWLITEYKPESGLFCKSMTRPEEPVHCISERAVDRTWMEVHPDFPKFERVWCVRWGTQPQPPRHVMEAIRADYVKRWGPLPPEVVPMADLPPPAEPTTTKEAR